MRRRAIATVLCVLLGVSSSMGAAEAQSANERACPADEVPPARFSDVPAGNPHLRDIDCAVWWRLVSGTTSTTFSPTQTITRGQATALLERLVLRTPAPLPESPSDHFDDDDGDVHELAINRLAEVGLLTGTGPRQFSPSRAVTRAQLASIFVATMEYAGGFSLPAGRDAFADDDGNVHEASINKLAAAGVVAGVTTTEFVPDGGSTRAQAATFLVRSVAVLAARDRATRRVVAAAGGTAPSASGAAWTNAIRYSFVADTADTENERDAIRAAMVRWQAASAVRFQEVAPTAEPDVEIGFATRCYGRDECFDGPGGTVAHATTGAVPDAYAFFDDDESWERATGPTPENELELFAVALHELGHVIGLEHSTKPESVMFPGYDGGSSELQDDDIAAAQALYPVS